MLLMLNGWWILAEHAVNDMINWYYLLFGDWVVVEWWVNADWMLVDDDDDDDDDHHYESQPVGLAEVIDASEASLGGPGGRPSQMAINRVKMGQIGGENGF